MQIVKTKRLGLEVYLVLVNRLVVAQFMSEAGALTYVKQRGLV